jgi:hypothetical protein
MKEIGAMPHYHRHLDALREQHKSKRKFLELHNKNSKTLGGTGCLGPCHSRTHDDVTQMPPSDVLKEAVHPTAHLPTRLWQITLGMLSS